MRKYRAYVEERFPNFDVLNNLMFLDKQIQDLQKNHEVVRALRENENVFGQLVDVCKESQDQNSKIYNAVMKNRSMKERQHISPDRKDAPTTEAYLTRLHSQEPTLMS